MCPWAGATDSCLLFGLVLRLWFLFIFYKKLKSPSEPFLSPRCRTGDFERRLCFEFFSFSTDRGSMSPPAGTLALWEKKNLSILLLHSGEWLHFTASQSRSFLSIYLRDSWIYSRKGVFVLTYSKSFTVFLVIVQYTRHSQGLNKGKVDRIQWTVKFFLSSSSKVVKVPFKEHFLCFNYSLKFFLNLQPPNPQHSFESTQDKNLPLVNTSFFLLRFIFMHYNWNVFHICRTWALPPAS